MPKYMLCESTVLAVPGGVSLDPMLAHHAASSDKHMHTAVSPLSNCGVHRQDVTLNRFSCTYGRTVLP